MICCNDFLSYNILQCMEALSTDCYLKNLGTFWPSQKASFILNDMSWTFTIKYNAGKSAVKCHLKTLSTDAKKMGKVKPNQKK